jgi:cytoskeletal protein RodZ
LTDIIKLTENIDLEEFKNSLKIARESKNISIEEASNLIRININILKNLENGKFDKLANDVFMRGHIRTYLTWLGMDPSIFVYISDSKAETNIEIKKNKINTLHTLKLSKFYISIISLILFILIILFYKNINKLETSISENTSEVQGDLKESTINNLELEKKSEAINTSKVKPNEELKKVAIPINTTEEIKFIYISANTDSWIEIQKNNLEILVSKVIKKDEKIKIPYEKGLILVTGNAGGIIIQIKDKIINNIGKPGEVKRNISLNYDDLIKF